VLNRKVWE